MLRIRMFLACVCTCILRSLADLHRRRGEKIGQVLGNEGAFNMLHNILHACAGAYGTCTCMHVQEKLDKINNERATRLG